MADAPVKRSILVVANDGPARGALLRYLTLSSYQTLIAETAQEAVQHLNLQPDLVLLDMIVSGMDGLLILRDLNEKNDQTRILLLVEESDTPKAQAALTHGARDYITKPIQLPALKRMLQVHLPAR